MLQNALAYVTVGESLGRGGCAQETTSARGMLRAKDARSLHHLPSPSTLIAVRKYCQ